MIIYHQSAQYRDLKMLKVVTNPKGVSLCVCTIEDPRSYNIFKLC
jgi:hypothetical protein